MTIIYQTETPPPQHKCITFVVHKFGTADKYGANTIVKCMCGRYLYAYHYSGLKYWRYVEWFNFDLKRKIREYESKS